MSPIDANLDIPDTDDLTVPEVEELYNAALKDVQRAAAASPEERQRCGQRLALISKALRLAKRKPEKRQRPEWSTYPEAVALPRCSDDARYVKSFSTEAHDLLAAQSFFQTYGFVVFKDVLSEAECEATVAEIWTSLEERTEGLARDVPESWPLLSSERYGLPEEQAVFTPQMVANRQNARVYAALDAVLPRMDAVEDFDSPHPDPNSVVVTQDRWCIYRPAGDDESARTAENLHLDVNPWTYAGLKPTEIESLRYGTSIAGDHRFPLQDFRAELTAVQGRGGPTGEHVQGVMNLLDNLEEDGGTRLVPGFHRSFMAWLEALGDLESNLAQSGQHDNWVLRRAAGGGSFKFSNLDPIHQLSRRIPMRAGSFLLWNQLVVHGSCSNKSSNFRMAQFITGFRAGEMSPGRAWARARAVHRHCHGLTLMPLAAHVFGEVMEAEDWRPSLYKAGDSREQLATEQVLRASRDPEAVLKAFEDFHVQCKPLLHVGPLKGRHLDDAVRRSSPSLVLELGSYLGYSAVRISRLLRDGAVLYTVEEDADKAAKAEAIIKHAGLSKTFVLHGTLESLQSQLPKPVDLVFLDHSKALYVAEIHRLEDLGFIRPGTTVVADNIGGCSRANCGRVNCGCAYARYVRDGGRYSSEFFWGSRDGIEVSVAQDVPKLKQASSEQRSLETSISTPTWELPYLVGLGLPVCSREPCEKASGKMQGLVLGWCRAGPWQQCAGNPSTPKQDSCVGPYVVDLAVCASATCFTAANAIMRPRLLVLLKEYQRHRKLSELESKTFVDFMAAGALACGFYRFCEFNVRQPDATAQAKDSYRLMGERAELLLNGQTREEVLAFVSTFSRSYIGSHWIYWIGFLHRQLVRPWPQCVLTGGWGVMRRLWHSPLVVLFVAIALHLQGCDDDEDGDDKEEKEEKVKPEVVSQGNATKEAADEHVWSGEHHRSTYGGPPAQLGHFDERQKKVQPDVLPGKGGKLLEAERSFERALLANSGAEQQVRNLEKEKHLEDYYKHHPTTTSTTSSSTEAPTSEDGEGGHREDENTTDAKGNEESGKAATEEGEDTNEESHGLTRMRKAANATNVTNATATNATNSSVEPPEPAAKVGAGKAAPTGPAVKEELEIEHVTSLAPSAAKTHHAFKPIDQVESAAGSKETEDEESQKPDQASSFPDEKEAKGGGKIERAEAAEAAVATNVNNEANKGTPKEPKQTAQEEEQPEPPQQIKETGQTGPQEEETPPEPAKNTKEMNQIEEPKPSNEEHEMNEEIKETGHTEPQEEETPPEPAKNTKEMNQIEEPKPSNEEHEMNEEIKETGQTEPQEEETTPEPSNEEPKPSNEEHEMNEEQSQEESGNAVKPPVNPAIQEEAGGVETPGENPEGGSPEMEAGKVPKNSEKSLEDAGQQDGSTEPDEDEGTKPALIEVESHQAQRNSRLQRNSALLELQVSRQDSRQHQYMIFTDHYLMLVEVFDTLA
eukprot:s251_g40.t1